MIKLELEQDEVEAIIAVLGDLPTKSNAWPLVVKIQQQAAPQIPQEDAEEQ